MRVRNVWWSILIIGIFVAAQSVSAQKPPSQPAPPPPTQGMPTASPTNNNANTAPVETVQPPSKQENKAIKSFRDVQPNEADKKTQLGENFIQTYPDSRYRPEVVSWLASAYMRKGEVDKLQSEGDKELAIAQKNPLSLAALGSNLARAVNANTPDLAKTSGASRNILQEVAGDSSDYPETRRCFGRKIHGGEERNLRAGL